MADLHSLDKIMGDERVWPKLHVDSSQLPVNGLDIDELVRLDILAKVVGVRSEDGKREVTFELQAASIDSGKSKRISELRDLVISKPRKVGLKPGTYMIAGEG